MVIPRSVIPKWFRYQCMGAEVNIKEPSCHLCTNEWMGIAICVVFCSLSHHQFKGYRSLSCHIKDFHLILWTKPEILFMGAKA